MIPTLSSTLSPLELSRLMITRFSHDITGPVGAINNGVEFIEQDKAMQGQAMELIASSAQQAVHRIQFYRYAYGLLKGADTVNVHENQALIENFYASSRITLHWQIHHATLLQDECQILYNLMLFAGLTLIRGGELHVTLSEQIMEVNASGTDIRCDSHLREAIMQPAAHKPDTKTVQAYYTALLVAEKSASLTLDVNESSCLLRYGT